MGFVMRAAVDAFIGMVGREHYLFGIADLGDRSEQGIYSRHGGAIADAVCNKVILYK